MAKTILALSMLIGTACGADDVALPQPGPQTTTTDLPVTTTTEATTTTTEPEPTTTVTEAPEPVVRAVTTVPTTRTRSAPTTAVYVAPTTVYVGPVAGGDGSSAPLACIRRYEQGAAGYASDTGNGFYGAYQFDLDTWGSVGGSGNPADASVAEQDMRAQMLYDSRGLAPWPTPAAMCR
jgi:hypothetical protein